MIYTFDYSVVVPGPVDTICYRFRCLRLFPYYVHSFPYVYPIFWILRLRFVILLPFTLTGWVCVDVHVTTLRLFTFGDCRYVPHASHYTFLRSYVRLVYVLTFYVYDLFTLPILRCSTLGYARTLILPFSHVRLPFRLHTRFRFSPHVAALHRSRCSYALRYTTLRGYTLPHYLLPLTTCGLLFCRAPHLTFRYTLTYTPAYALTVVRVTFVCLFTVTCCYLLLVIYRFVCCWCNLLFPRLRYITDFVDYVHHTYVTARSDIYVYRFYESHVVL